MDFVAILNRAGQFVPHSPFSTLTIGHRYRVMRLIRAQSAFNEFGESIAMFFLNEQGEMSKVYLPARYITGEMSVDFCEQFDGNTTEAYFVYGGPYLRTHILEFQS